jgi:hypothetical protein
VSPFLAAVMGASLHHPLRPRMHYIFDADSD